MKKIKKWFIKKLPVFVFNTKKHYPPIIDINLLVCSYDCNYVDLGTAKFKHICNYCNKEKVIVFKSPLAEANRNGGRFWKFTCSNKECQTKHNSKIQKMFHVKQKIVFNSFNKLSTILTSYPQLKK